jgi:orotate phosphoribosyltransferase
MKRRASRMLSIGSEEGFDQSDIAVLIDDLGTSGGREIEAADHFKVAGVEVAELISTQQPSKVTYDA